MTIPRPLAALLILAAAGLGAVGGCQSNSDKPAKRNPPDPGNINDPTQIPALRPPYRGSRGPDAASPAAVAGGVDTRLHAGRAVVVGLAGARNEWVSFTAELPPVGKVATLTLRAPARGGSRLPASAFTIYQVLPMPVDADQAGYVRQTGLHLSNQRLPRALLPLPSSVEGNAVSIDLAAARDPAAPADPNRRAAGTGRPVELWFDLKIPIKADPGDYSGRLEIASEGAPAATADVKLTVYPFVLPDKRTLQMVGRLDWDSLRRLYPDRFEAVTPRLMTRDDPRYLPAVQTLDALVALGQENRAQVAVPRLQPTVKWPAQGDPQIDWRDFDSLVRPWMSGDAFTDKEPLSQWPLPRIDHLDSYPPDAQLAYWASAANHFDQFDWLARSAVWLDESDAGRPERADRERLSTIAARTLGAHPRLRVAVPLRPDEVQFVDSSHPDAVKPASADRLLPTSTGLISETAMGTWPDGVKKPDEWLRTDQSGLVPFVGAGAQEEDVRVWAWLAFLRKSVDIIRWPDALPDTSGPDQAAEPGDLIWFYPGQWFGVDKPLASVQLKWLRRAEQDYEYLQLTRDRGEPLNAFLLARSLTKPVEIQARQSADPVYALMTGTVGHAPWTDALDLLARTIELHEPGETVDKAADSALELEITRELAPRDRPLLVARSAEWRITAPGDGPGGTSPVKLTLGLDIYNPSDSRPENNQLAWSGIPAGWNVRPEPQVIPSLTTYQIQPFDMSATVDPSSVERVPGPAEVSFINGFRREATPVSLCLPLARTLRREGSLSIDGKLGDWSDDDAIQRGPMALMDSRPAIQNHELRRASTDALLYTGWSDTDLYVAFHVNGLDAAAGRSAKNFVSYQFRRAWDEDVCEILVQGVYEDGSAGPLLHVCPKPNGGAWSEQRPVAVSKSIPEAWQPVAAGIRYAATLGGGSGTDGSWRGEVAIPWESLNLPGKGRPALLRFNFSQHRQSDGESASWAGPVDFGRDDTLMGCLYLTETTRPGMASKE